jgi:hypothetical protein
MAIGFSDGIPQDLDETWTWTKEKNVRMGIVVQMLLTYSSAPSRKAKGLTRKFSNN